jgi:hypothetical protein
MAATSEPASGSDSANAAIASPRRRAAGSARAWASLPNRLIAPRAQALHGEREIGQARCGAPAFRGSGRWRACRWRRCAAAAADRVAQPAALAQLAHQRAAGGVDVVPVLPRTCCAAQASSAASSSRVAASKNGQSR